MYQLLFFISRIQQMSFLIRGDTSLSLLRYILLLEFRGNILRASEIPLSERINENELSCKFEQEEGNLSCS